MEIKNDKHKEAKIRQNLKWETHFRVGYKNGTTMNHQLHLTLNIP